MFSHASATYISASVNRYPHAAAASASGRIASASHKFLAFWNTADQDDRGVISTLPGHGAEITVVKSFSVAGDGFLSGDKLGHIAIWRARGDKWSLSHLWQAHKEPISALAISGDLILTGSSDGTLKSWHYSQSDVGEDQITERQVIDLKRRYPLDIAITVLPNSASIIAVGTTSRVIDIYVCGNDRIINLALSLEGHEDWIRSLAFSPVSPDNAIVLASGSQDSYIRLWTVKPSVPKAVDATSTDPTDDLLDAFERSLNEVGSDEPGRQLSTREHIFSARGPDGNPQTYSLAFDALLVGHEASVNSVAWRPGSSSSSLQLLSSSTDASLIVWESIDSGAGAIWGSVQRFGDVGGQRAGGFVGALWIGSGDIAGWGWGGGWRRWKRAEGEAEAWTEINAPTGHNAPVKGLAWSPKGEYIVSTSQDQTTRIHGPVGASRTWHELARPQVHGYDLTDAAFVGPGALRLVSCADEKIARVFDAPKGFVKTVCALGTVDWEGEQANEAARPAGASLPPLGLSNKATEDLSTLSSEVTNGEPPSRPPFESELASVTLWPEAEKLFGHGYELHTLAVSSSGSLVATACRATSRDHAVIRLHSSSNWQPVGTPLVGHTLTVTRIAFSHDGHHVLSVSRDRSWRLFGRTRDSSDGDYEPVADNASHGRIIWDCAWSPDDKIFVTASRDKTVRVWSGQEPIGKAITTIKLKEAATAVALVDHLERRILAIGLETGHVLLYSSTLDSPDKWTYDATLDSNLVSVGQVHRLNWQPTNQLDVSPKRLAMCSEDRTVRVLDIYIN
ncbi:elongator complex protein 2 [Ceratobasidium sp. AG-Ba]|nr:elongator complex protein 2 [Ceratobasidium sp. AG-Ba]